MNKASSEARLDALLGALSDQTRRAIILRLAQGEARVTEVAEPFGISLNAVSKHVKVLEASGLVNRRIAGREHFLSVKIETLESVDQWLRRARAFWEGRLDALEELLRKRRQLEARKRGEK